MLKGQGEGQGNCHCSPSSHGPACCSHPGALALEVPGSWEVPSLALHIPGSTFVSGLRSNVPSATQSCPSPAPTRGRVTITSSRLESFRARSSCLLIYGSRVSAMGTRALRTRLCCPGHACIPRTGTQSSQLRPSPPAPLPQVPSTHPLSPVPTGSVLQATHPPLTFQHPEQLRSQMSFLLHSFSLITTRAPSFGFEKHASLPLINF